MVSKETDYPFPNTQIGLHSVKNLLGSEGQFAHFDEGRAKEFSEKFGVTLEREISRYGINLTDVQQRLMEGILHGFTRTQYEGNVAYEDPKEKYPNGTPPSFKYLQKLPRLRATQAEILQWAGVNRKSAGDVQEAVDALRHLATYQYCFYYTRLAFNEKGEPQKDIDGDWMKEEVMGIDTLFTIRSVRDKNTKELKYYEITPSSLFLDQRESYFMLIPFNWREEVCKLVGQRKASSYTFRFLLFLRYQFELKRRSPKEKKPYVIKWTPEEIGIAIKMPESIYKKHKKKANAILESAYSVAQRLGYLTRFERTHSVDTLYLNEEKYYAPQYKENLMEQEESPSQEMIKAKELLDFFQQKKKEIQSKYNPVGGEIQQASLRYLAALIARHSFDIVKSVIDWGLKRPYWCTRIGTPSKLSKFFNEAYTEMQVSKIAGPPEERGRHHKEYVQSFLATHPNLRAHVEALNEHVEIGTGMHVTCINYSEKSFKTQFEHALRNWGYI